MDAAEQADKLRCLQLADSRSTKRTVNIKRLALRLAAQDGTATVHSLVGLREAERVVAGVQLLLFDAMRMLQSSTSGISWHFMYTLRDF